MVEAPEFKAFPKIARLSRDIIITEKLDGTNGVVHVADDGRTVTAGSRNRWLDTGKGNDNFGFYQWVQEHTEELAGWLGPGYHYGEWWGRGIQRGYGLEEKRFSLFNTSRWSPPAVKPPCCDVVPILYAGPFDMSEVDRILDAMRRYGSAAAPGYMQPEGIVIFHTASKELYKKTLVGDEKPKGSKE